LRSELGKKRAKGLTNDRDGKGIWQKGGEGINTKWIKIIR
jgi:hypothetical protein